MRIDAKIEYYEPYLPTKRHRIPRYRKVVEDILIELPEIKKTDAVLAFIVEDYCSYLDENGKNKYGIMLQICLNLGKGLEQFDNDDSVSGVRFQDRDGITTSHIR